MSIFMRTWNYLMWDVVVDDLFVPMRKISGSKKQMPKQISKWTNADVKKIEINFKAINTLHCALNSTKFNRISTYKTAKKIWDKCKHPFLSRF